MTEIPNILSDAGSNTVLDAPDTQISVRETFGIDIDMMAPAFSEADERVPDLDPSYVFDPDTTLAILAGFAFNRRVMVQGYHGTGKSTHIEQVAARLKWPCIRINLDAHISRIDLIGAMPSCCATDFRSPNSVKACCPGRSSIRWRWCSTNTMPAVRRDVRHPARAGDRGQADPARSEPGDPPQQALPPFLHRQHGGPRRHQRTPSWHPGDQPGPDRPPEHRRRAESSCC